MMEGASDVSALKMLNHKLVKLDRFDGTNFSRWKYKMKFLLTALKLFYVLDPNLINFPPTSDEDTDEIKAQRKKWEDILNTVSDRLYDLLINILEPFQVGANRCETPSKLE